MWPPVDIAIFCHRREKPYGNSGLEALEFSLYYNTVCDSFHVEAVADYSAVGLTFLFVS